MYLQQLKNISFCRGLSQADLARMAGVSRAAVTKWFHGGSWVNVETTTLQRLATALQIAPEAFFQERALLSPFMPQFLWDYLYPDMESFVKAVYEKRRPALARLVQVLGFHEAQTIAGKKVVTLFEKYKKFIKPVRRKQLEILWPLYSKI